MRLKQEGQIYELADMATLQRWIVERRVNPHDQVSFDGDTWEVVRTRPDLKVFFQIVNQVEQAEARGREEASSGGLPREDTEEAPWRLDGTRGPPAEAEGDEMSEDAFAGIREDEVSDGGSGESFNSGEWDPVDPPSPRLQTDHGFNPSAIGTRMPQEEADTLSRGIPSVTDEDALVEPKTIALGAPLGSASMEETEEQDDPFFAAPTDLDVDGMTEEALPAVDPFFRVPVDDPEPLPDDGPDLPPVEHDFPPASDDFISAEEIFDREEHSDTIFSVTDDEGMDEDDELWFNEQKQAAKTRKIGLALMAALAAGALIYINVGGDEDESPAEGVAEASSPASAEEPGEGTASANDGPEDEPYEPGPAEVPEPTDTPDSVVQGASEEAQPPAQTPTASRSGTGSSSTTASRATTAPTQTTSSSGGGSVSRLVDEGWDYVGSSDMKTAQNRFQQALSKDPRSAAAQYGMGYATENLGNVDQAVTHYCQALKYNPGVDDRREAEGRLRALGRTCN